MFSLNDFRANERRDFADIFVGLFWLFTVIEDIRSKLDLSEHRMEPQNV